ncbi:MAG: efflux RND transporter permease subunit, partial [Planctomycetota bacterium]
EEEKTQDSKSTSESYNPIMLLYEGLVRLVLAAKWVTVAGTILICIAILNLPVSSEFFPQADRDQFAVKIELPQTATIAQTDEIARQVEEIIRKLSAVVENDSQIGDKTQRLRSMRTLVGGGGSRWHLGWDPEPRSANYAEILIRTSDGGYTTEFAERLRHACVVGDEDLGIEPVVGARIVPIELALGPPADPLLFRITGNGFADPQVLRQAALDLRQVVDKQPETWNVNDSWGVNGYQIRVNIDKDRATLAGVTNAQVARTLNSYYSGLRLTTFREGDHQIPIYFRLKPDQRGSIRGLQESYVEGSKGKVPLAALADFEYAWELAKIERRNMNRVIEVSSRMEPGVTGNDVVNRLLQDRTDPGDPDSTAIGTIQKTLPAGYWIEPGGSYAESQDAAGQMGMSFAASLILIVLCLVFQYNGFAKPLIIIGTLPLALVGAWLGLFLTDNSLGFMPQLGILALFGIVLNTAIIFVEFADILIAAKSKESQGDGPIAGLSVAEFRSCLIEAGKQRMLPIFLTTATTVGGLIPLALTGGPLWVGLAWCMIVGLLFTTVLTLFLVPAFYAVLVETFGVRPIANSAEDD